MSRIGFWYPLAASGRTLPSLQYWSNGYSPDIGYFPPSEPSSGTIAAGDLMGIITLNGSLPLTASVGTWLTGPTVTTNSQTFRVYYKFASAANEGWGTWGTGSTQRNSGVFVARDVDPSAPFADLTGAFLSTNNMTINFPSGAAANDNTLAMLMPFTVGGFSMNSVSMSSLSSLTEYSEGVSGVSGTFEGTWTGVKSSAGSISSGTMTISHNRNNKYGLMLLLNGKP